MTATPTDATRDMIRARSSQIALIQDASGLGTGLVVGTDGWVLTNKHVAPGVGPYRVVLANGVHVLGVGVHQSPHHDLAIVKVGIPTPDRFDLEGEVAEDYHVGEEVYALGHPRGCRFSVARGIVSNPYREFDKEYFIQTDVSINPGNSGGPLVDAHGRLVGIVSMMLSHSQGLGFAVPGYTAADYVRAVRRLVRQGVVKIPEALLATAALEATPPEEIVRGAIELLTGAGRVSVEEETPEMGHTKLRRRNAFIDVRCAEGALTVTSTVSALGPTERNNAGFLARLLTLNGGRELGGASLALKDEGLSIGVTRPTTNLDTVHAYWAIDLVVRLVDEWGEKLAGMVFGHSLPPPAPPGDPGYPLIQLPEPPSL